MYYFVAFIYHCFIIYIYIYRAGFENKLLTQRNGYKTNKFCAYSTVKLIQSNQFDS